MNVEEIIQQRALETVSRLYEPVDGSAVQIQKTRKEFEGDFTLVVFPLLKVSRKAPEATAAEMGDALVAQYPVFKGYNVIKGFLNLSLSDAFWIERFAEMAKDPSFGWVSPSGRTYMVEYSSPNTNKPLHLGHIRNNLLGYSVSRILEANGHKVIKVNLVNDRGIHICKSMLAWQKYGGGETLQSSGLKGDHLVGKYYVEFDKHYKAEIGRLVEQGMDGEEAKQSAPSILEAQQMLRRWEAKDPETIALWEMMNGWVYEGFDETYKALGVGFDKIYYESDTYLLGKNLVEDGLERGVFYRREDGSVWIDLTPDGLDEKLLLRSDGTSVYMTQDLGTALERHKDFSFDSLVYVVGNEQNYHFQVLKLILKKLGYDWSDAIYHLSYGMVELPEGKMKSREGTVVDADDLIAGMVGTAREMSAELGKLDGCSEEEAAAVSRMVGMGALKYFLLKVDPRKTMLFDPRESIDFNGNTGPFIQYTHARIKSILRKADEQGLDCKDAPAAEISLTGPEIELIKQLSDLPATIQAAGDNYSPALVAQYAYELAKLFNGFYHDVPVLREQDEALRLFRLKLSAEVATVISRTMGLLGIEVPERM